VVEIDSFDPRALALIRRSIGTPLASCESLFGRRQFKDFFENYAMDVGIIDLPWNGILESMKIASMAEAYEVNCAPHNFYGHMSTLMSAHFCAAIPNFRIMEIDIDDVPWKDDLVTEPPRIENGHLIMPTKPGWGGDINEDALKRHPPLLAMEPRPLMSVPRLWRDQGKREDARELLAPVYGWFTEGFNTRDLKEAKALLYELAV
jgi:galactonate dehydratase